jgi:cell division protease FtsH
MRERPAMVDQTTQESLGKRTAEVEFTPAVVIAANLMVKRCLRGDPAGRKALMSHGVAIVVEVPSRAWVEPVSGALSRYAFPQSCPSALLAEADKQDWDEFFEDEEKPTKRRWHTIEGVEKPKSGTNDARELMKYFSQDCTVIGISDAPHAYLPKDLLRVEDHRLVMPSLRPTDISAMAQVVTGTRSTRRFPANLCRLLDPDDIRLAQRARQSADDFLARLEKLVTSRLAKTNLTLDHLAGMSEAVAWGHALAIDLAAYAAGNLAWSQVDKGALLHGSPGTGKTTFAKALAGTCGIPLILGSLYKWQSKGHLGDMQRAMRETFEQARKSAPCILFIDELDSFGDRERLTHEYRDYSIQVINGFLEELDGVAGREGVVVLGACNHPGRIDSAIRRPGRLDRLIHIPLPDKTGLVGILRHHLDTDLKTADLSGVAHLLTGRTGADIEQLVRDARRSARKCRRPLMVDDLIDKIRGPAQAPDEDLRMRALHEAGHAVAAVRLFPGALMSVDIKREGTRGGGVSLKAEAASNTRESTLEIIRFLLCGRAAEEIIGGVVTDGAGGARGSDLAKATAVACDMVCSSGLTGDLLWTGTVEDYQGKVGLMLSHYPGAAEKVRDILKQQYAAAQDLVREHLGAVQRVADMLLKHTAIPADQVERVVRTYPCDISTPTFLV